MFFRFREMVPVFAHRVRSFLNVYNRGRARRGWRLFLDLGVLAWWGVSLRMLLRKSEA